MEIFEIFQYSFIQRAFIAGSFVAVACSLLGLFLVLRKMSLIGDGLSHVGFGAIALGLFFGVYPLYIAVPIVILASIAILKITEKANIYADAAIGIVSAVGIAGGVVLASMAGGFNVDLFSYLFGNILAISLSEVIMSAVLSMVVILSIWFFYWDIFSATFDQDYAKTTGIKTEFINLLLTVLTAITVILSIKVVGVMLVSALLILPAITAMQVSFKFKTTLFLGAIFSLLSVVFGIIISFILDLPPGGTIVLLNGVFLFFAIVYKKLFK